MGVTSRLLLPYPELNDPANVPTDMKELADRIEAIIGGPVPAPICKTYSTLQHLTTTASVPLQPSAGLTNPHPSLFLVVQILGSPWVAAMTNVFYGDLKVTGYAAFAGIGYSRLEGQYGNADVSGIATIAPGATLVAQVQGRLGTAKSTDVPSVRLAVTPVGWAAASTINT